MEQKRTRIWVTSACSLNVAVSDLEWHQLHKYVQHSWLDQRILQNSYVGGCRSHWHHSLKVILCFYYQSFVFYTLNLYNCFFWHLNYVKHNITIFNIQLSNILIENKYCCRIECKKNKWCKKSTTKDCVLKSMAWCCNMISHHLFLQGIFYIELFVLKFFFYNIFCTKLSFLHQIFLD